MHGDEVRLRVEGFEPPHLSVPDPKSGASASSAIPALRSFYFNQTRSPILRETANESAEKIGAILRERLIAFRGALNPVDDITFVIVKSVP